MFTRRQIDVWMYSQIWDVSVEWKIFSLVNHLIKWFMCFMLILGESLAPFSLT
jgi:hypothetical protein